MHTKTNIVVPKQNQAEHASQKKNAGLLSLPAVPFLQMKTEEEDSSQLSTPFLSVAMARERNGIGTLSPFSIGDGIAHIYPNGPAQQNELKWLQEDNIHTDDTPQMMLPQQATHAVQQQSKLQPVEISKQHSFTQRIIQRVKHLIDGKEVITPDAINGAIWQQGGNGGYYHFIQKWESKHNVIEAIRLFYNLKELHIHIVNGNLLVTIAAKQGAQAGDDFGHWHYACIGNSINFQRTGTGNLSNKAALKELADAVIAEFAGHSRVGNLQCELNGGAHSIGDLAGACLQRLQEKRRLEIERQEAELEKTKKREKKEKKKRKKEKKEKKEKKKRKKEKKEKSGDKKKRREEPTVNDN